MMGGSGTPLAQVVHFDQHRVQGLHLIRPNPERLAEPFGEHGHRELLEHADPFSIRAGCLF
jgi:hypothetical protein